MHDTLSPTQFSCPAPQCSLIQGATAHQSEGKLSHVFVKCPHSRRARFWASSRDQQGSLSTPIYPALFHWNSRSLAQNPFAPPPPQFLFAHPPDLHTPMLGVSGWDRACLYGDTRET